MSPLQIVTDSFAYFPTGSVPENVTVVPNTLTINGKTYREGIDLSNEDAFRLMAQASLPSEVSTPSVADFAAVFERLSRTSDGIISVHASREMFDSWQNAQIAAQPFNGRCRIGVVDSQTLAAAQAMLVKLAAREARNNDDVDDIVRLLRGAVETVYSVFFVETVDTLMNHRILPPSQSILGAMLNIKPVLSIENGQLIAIEKVRTRMQAIERLVEFVIEFTDIIDAQVMQYRAGMTEQTRMLQDRLQVDFPNTHFPHAMYGASLAALVGLDATGLAVLENPTSGFDDDY